MNGERWTLVFVKGSLANSWFLLAAMTNQWNVDQMFTERMTLRADPFVKYIISWISRANTTNPNDQISSFAVYFLVTFSFTCRIYFPLTVRSLRHVLHIWIYGTSIRNFRGNFLKIETTFQDRRRDCKRGVKFVRWTSYDGEVTQNKLRWINDRWFDS